MKSIALVCTIMSVVFASCSNSHKDAKTDTSEYDTVKTDSGVSIIKTKQGKIVKTMPTNESLTHGGSAPLQNSPGTANDIAPKTVAAQEYPYYVEGVLIHGEGGNITLDRLDEGQDIKPLYVQAANTEGRFGFQGACSAPLLMQLRLPAGNIQFIVRPKDTIDFTIVLEDPKDYKVYGSPESLQLEEVFNILNDANAKKEVVEDKLKNAVNNRPLYIQMLKNRVKQYKAINEAKRASLMKYMTKIDTSYAAVLASAYLDPNEDFDFLKNLDDKMRSRYAGTSYYEALDKKVAAYLPLEIGHIAPDIVSQTSEGKPFKLSSLKGKVVLLDFWASYAPQSRTENPHFEKLYKKYKGKGFEIVSYSVDNQKSAWTQASGDDNMNWINVCDLLGYGSAGAKTYLITDVPHDFLIDRNGMIVAKNIYGKDLDQKLGSIVH